jgi:hypothetical protein
MDRVGLIEPHTHCAFASIVKQSIPPYTAITARCSHCNEEGQKLTGLHIGRAGRKRTELYHRIRHFMESHEFLDYTNGLGLMKRLSTLLVIRETLLLYLLCDRLPAHAIELDDQTAPPLGVS